jgi:hypothetical protein
MADMESMIENGLPCPWDDMLTLHTPKVYNELLKETKVELSNVMGKGTIHFVKRVQEGDYMLLLEVWDRYLYALTQGMGPLTL